MAAAVHVTLTEGQEWPKWVTTVSAILLTQIMKLPNLYHLNPELIQAVLEDESLHPADRVVKLAAMSMFGEDFDVSFLNGLSDVDKEQVRTRTILLGSATDSVATFLEPHPRNSV